MDSLWQSVLGTWLLTWLRLTLSVFVLFTLFYVLCQAAHLCTSRCPHFPICTTCYNPVHAAVWNRLHTSLLSTSASQLHKQKPRRVVRCSPAKATSLARDCLFRHNTVPPPQSLSAQPQMENTARNMEHVAADFWHPTTLHARTAE